MERASIKEKLESLAEEHGAGERDLWPRMEAQIRQSTPRNTSSSEWLPLPNPNTKSAARVKQARLDLGITVAMSAMLVLFGGLALALGWINTAAPRAGITLTPTATANPTTAGIAPTPKRDSTPTIPPVEWGFRGFDNIYGLGSPIGLTENRGGYTVTIERAYADANSIVVFYSMWSSTGERMTNLRTEKPLTLSDGTSKSITYEGSVSSSTSGPVGLPQRSRTTHLMAFSASDIGDLPNSLPLTLTLHVLDITKYESAHSKVIDPSIMPKEGSPALKAIAQEFIFNFTVPVTKAKTRVIELNSRVEVNGEAVTLERVVITPAEFRAVLRYPKAPEDVNRYLKRAHTWLVTGDPALDTQQQVPPLSYSLPVNTTDAMPIHTIVWPFADLSGEWTLNLYSLELDQIRTTRDTSASPPPKVITGPWTFTFKVPPVGE